MWAFSAGGEQGLLFIAGCGLLTAMASLVAEPRLWARGAGAAAAACAL